MTITINDNLIEFIEIENNIEVVNRTKNVSMTVLNQSFPTNEFEIETILLTCGNYIDVE